MGWSNDQATTLDGQAVTYTNSTTSYSTGSSLTVASDASFTINGLSPSLGIVARNFADTDQPAAGTTANTQAGAATVMTTTAALTRLNRIYLVQCPGLAARMNVIGGTGFQLTYTEDNSAPTAGSTALGAIEVSCPVAGAPFGSPFGISYTRRVADGPLRVCLSLWNTRGGGATTANALFGEKIELLVIDMGLDPGVTT